MVLADFLGLALAESRRVAASPWVPEKNSLGPATYPLLNLRNRHHRLFSGPNSDLRIGAPPFVGTQAGGSKHVPRGASILRPW